VPLSVTTMASAATDPSMAGSLISSWSPQVVRLLIILLPTVHLSIIIH